MSDDSEYWASLERRLSELENKSNNFERDWNRESAQLDQRISEITNRVNMGLSPSVQKAIQDTADGKLMISELRHGIDKSIIEMKSLVRETTDLTKLMVSNFDEHKLKPVANEVGLIKKTFVYGLVGAVIVFLGQKGINLAWDKIFKSDSPAATESASKH